MRSKFQRFNDGILELCHDVAGSGAFGQKLNVDGLSGLEPYECAHYQRMSIRSQDVDFAEQTGISLALKVQCRNLGGVAAARPGDKVLISGSTLYNIGSIDRSADGMTAFLYLEHVREVR